MVRNRRKPNATRRKHPFVNYEEYPSHTAISTNYLKPLNDPQFENISSESDENISRQTPESCIIKNNQTNSFESVSSLKLNTSSNNALNIDEAKCVCNVKNCTLKARLLASGTNSNNINIPSTLNQTPIGANSAVNDQKIVLRNPEIIENNHSMQRVSALESEVISCLANLKNFVNSEAAQLNDTISKIPLRCIVDPVTPQILNINEKQRSNNITSQINPPYNINIVNPNLRKVPQKLVQNTLYEKYMQNKEELTKHIKLVMKQNRKQFMDLEQQRNQCITELQYAERTKDYFKAEWIKTRLQYLNHLIEKVKAECKYDSNEINKFTFEQYLYMLEQYKHCHAPSLHHHQKSSTNVHQEMPQQVSKNKNPINKKFNLRQEELKFFSNDSLVEENRILKYPFGGIITNTNEQRNKTQQVKNQVVNPVISDDSTKLTPIPQYLMQNHTIVRSSEKEKRTNNDKILFKPYETTFNQKSIKKPHLVHLHRQNPTRYNQHIFNNPTNPSVKEDSQNKQHQFAIDQIMSKQHKNLNPSSYKNRNIIKNYAQPYIDSTILLKNYPVDDTTVNTKENKVKKSQLKQTNPNSKSKSAKNQKNRSSKKNKRKTVYVSENNQIKNDNSSNEIKNPPFLEPQLTIQGNPLRPKPALIPIADIKIIENKIVCSPNKQNKSAINLNEEIPNKRIKLDNSSSITLNTENVMDENFNKNKENSPEINDNTNIIKEISNSTNKSSDEENTENKKNTKTRHIRLQFKLISNKTITLSYLLKMMNQNLNNSSFSNFILKPKNIKELCNIIRKREIFLKIKENSPYQYPNVLTIMNHFLIYVIVCIQIENKVNYEELYLKLIRDKGPIRYDYYHEPDPISLENIDMYLQKAALELHEAIILNSAENNMKNNKCFCNKIKTFRKYSSQNDTEKMENNYVIKAHGETEISVIVLYEPKFKNATKITKKFAQKCRKKMPPENSSDTKPKTELQNKANEHIKNNSITFTNLKSSLNAELIINSYNTNIVPLKTITKENQSINLDSNKNISFNFDILQLAKSFETWEKLLENPENQRIVAEIFENHLNDQNKINDDCDTNKNKTIKNGSKRENSSSPDLDKTFDNIWNDMENSNELIAMSEEELEKEIVDLLDKDVNVNNEIIRKRRISLTETCSEPSFKNIRIQAEEIINSEKNKTLPNETQILTDKQYDINVEKLENIIISIRKPDSNLKEIETNICGDNANSDKNIKSHPTEVNSNWISSNGKSKFDSVLIMNNDFAKINKYKVIKIDAKSNLNPSIHETITNYWKTTDYKNKDQEKDEHIITAQNISTQKELENNCINMETQNKVNEDTIFKKPKYINKNPNQEIIKPKNNDIVEFRKIEETSNQYYNDPKPKINPNNKNKFVQKTPLNLSKCINNNEESKTEKKINSFLQKSQSNDKNDKCKRSKLEYNINVTTALDDYNTFLEIPNNFVDSKRLNNSVLEQSNKKQLENVNPSKFCINFNTRVYINEMDYEIILEILYEAAKPLYTFYKFVNTTRYNNNQPLINFTAFFFGLKFKKLQKYKKMYEELHKK